MTIEEIRKGAPESATHYLIDIDKVVYVKSGMVWIDGDWWFVTLSKNVELKPL